jgi:hypothetical protein
MINKLKVFSFEVDIYRVYFFGLILFSASFFAILFDVQGIPLFHVELFILAAFLHARIGIVFIIFSCLIACSRLIQGFLGFDQIFVSTYLLFRNFLNFPVNFLFYILIIIFLIFAVLYVLFIIIPEKKLIIKINFIVIFFALILIAKLSEDFSRINIIGSSFGYVYGQTFFANMLNSSYSTPGLNEQEYAGVIGAEVAIDNKFNYLLIVVESFGLPQNKYHAEEVLSPFKSEKLANKYLSLIHI